MTGEVISIGDELTSGQRLDTNSQWLSQRLGDLGVAVRYHTTVADDLEANERVFRAAAERAEVVVATGGLGPTADDLTREALAKVAGVELVLDEPSLEHIRGIFARFKRDMPERNRVQALFPAGSRPIENPCGTAPGIAQKLPRPDGAVCHVFALPGVPAEMREMFERSVAPAVAALLPAARVIRHRRLKCFGVGESHLEAMLPDLVRRGREPSVGITVHDATITLRITASGSTHEECLAAISQVETTIRKYLAELVFGEEDDELEDAVVRLLVERKQSLATQEWGTQGLLASWLARAAAGRDVYRGGFVASPLSPESFDEPPPRLDASRRDTIEALAITMVRLGCFGLVVGDFPAMSSADQAYFIALAEPHGKVVCVPQTLAGHPSIWRPRAAKQALNLLRLHLLRH